MCDEHLVTRPSTYDDRVRDESRDCTLSAQWAGQDVVPGIGNFCGCDSAFYCVCSSRLRYLTVTLRPLQALSQCSVSVSRSGRPHSALTRFPLTRRRRSAYVHSATRHKSRAALCAVHAHPSALAPPAPARCPSPAPAIATRDATSSLLTNTLPPQSPRRLARHVRRPTQPSHLMDGVAAPQRLTACQRLLG